MLSRHALLALTLIAFFFGGCKPQGVSFNKSQENVSRTVNLPKAFSGEKLGGSCMTSEHQCIEYRGLSAEDLAAQSKKCKTWQKAKSCPSLRLNGACFDKSAPNAVVHIYQGHPKVMSMSNAKLFCKSATYYPGK